MSCRSSIKPGPRKLKAKVWTKGEVWYVDDSQRRVAFEHRTSKIHVVAIDLLPFDIDRDEVMLETRWACVRLIVRSLRRMIGQT